MLKDPGSKQFKGEKVLKEPKESQGMTTVNGKGDKAHKVVQVALLLFCVNLISGRLMVLMDSSTNADIVQVVIQKPHSLFPTLITTPIIHSPTPNKNTYTR